MSQFHLTSTTRTIPAIPFVDIKNRILGQRYNLAVTILGSKRAQTLNQRSRGKSYIPNVLSFPLTNTAGEIYLCPAVAKREAKSFGRTEHAQLVYLFIHGLLHLKGYDHGAAMDRLEQRWCRTFDCLPTAL
jgi:probable rRNA maturation factor